MPGARKAAKRLYRFAELVLAMLLAVMFLAFIVQIAFRYLFNFPIGWTSELTVITWLWLVLWGAAFVVRESEEIRFDLIYSAVGTGTRRIMAIVTAVVTLGHAMGLQVTAEGVETSDQEDFLRSAGCNVLQGFLFSKAVPASELRSSMERHARRAA